MTDQQTKRATQRAGSANNIEDQLIPILKGLLGEIKRKSLDDSKWGLLDKQLANDLDTYVRLAGHVRNSLMGQQWKGGDSTEVPVVSIDCPKDPWLANLGSFWCLH